MTGTNHAVTGAVLVAAIANPVVAIPLAFASHFLLDSLPHFGESNPKLSSLTKKVWTVDFIVLSSFLLILFLTSNWFLLAGAFAAISPDFAWIYRFVFKEKLGKVSPTAKNKFNNFHSSIQNYETKNGIVIEIVWFTFITSILLSITS
jgi:hypothetical protein